MRVWAKKRPAYYCRTYPLRVLRVLVGLEVLVESQRIQPECGIIRGQPILRRMRRHGLGGALLITGEQIAAQILFSLPSASRFRTFLGEAIGAGVAPSRLCSLHALRLTL